MVNKMVPYFLLLLAAFAVAAGVSMIISGQKLRGFSTTPGRIVERGVKRATTTGATKGAAFEPQVKYTYTVDGKSYTGERIGPMLTAYDEDSAKKAAAQFPDEVQVRYNPKSPGEAYLQLPSMGMAALFLGLGVVGLLIGVGILLGRKG